MGGIGKSIWVDMKGGGVENGQKLATSFMDGPLIKSVLVRQEKEKATSLSKSKT